MQRLRFSLPLLTASVLLGMSAAQAQMIPDPSPATRSVEVWRDSDACLTKSMARYPDQDLASQRARDSFVDACLKQGGLPPRQHLAPAAN